jgi:DNA-binding transcriptional ArsR family regulator
MISSRELRIAMGSPRTQRLEALLKAVAEQRRLAILWLVRDRELPAGEIARHFRTTRQAISQHLKVLTEVGLLEHRGDGTRRLYQANGASLKELQAGLDAFWNQGLSSLERTVARRKRRRG